MLGLRNLIWRRNLVLDIVSLESDVFHRNSKEREKDMTLRYLENISGENVPRDANFFFALIHRGIRIKRFS